MDLVLVAELSTFEGSALLDAIESTFQSRGRQVFPERLAPPPDTWRDTYHALALEVEINPSIEAEWRAASAFLNPVLGGEVDLEAVCSPDERRWVVR